MEKSLAERLAEWLYENEQHIVDEKAFQEINDILSILIAHDL